ncbi:hypothetical protein GPECTOR_32g419 [Gonium pectorale]|uniref:SHSP domain-containing protein n=1 Tax=Gonium pectorale TaxID=33097 RepID=A0A150GD85_GONPE|nr:hypothetical protein GPECTOR_32g419 [Gonium pectorale]|eukprot:KXZ47807.1 hypothetical protein GPECTOR_32g419 [Gonium pectorale]
MALSTVFADPFFTDVDRVMNRMIGNALGSSLLGNSAVARSGAASHSPSLHAMDILETPQSYELHADTPGLAPEDVKVELQEGVLTVSGERKVSHQTSGGKVWRSERSSYSFSRSFTLPENADIDRITASVDKGVLTVIVPKKEPPAKPEPKRITVTGA